MSLKILTKRSHKSDQMTICKRWYRFWLNTEQATSHYLDQWWLRLLTHICVTRPRWLDNVWYINHSDILLCNLESSSISAKSLIFKKVCSTKRTDDWWDILKTHLCMYHAHESSVVSKVVSKSKKGNNHESSWSSGSINIMLYPSYIVTEQHTILITIMQWISLI